MDVVSELRIMNVEETIILYLPAQGETLFCARRADSHTRLSVDIDLYKCYYVLINPDAATLSENSFAVNELE